MACESRIKREEGGEEEVSSAKREAGQKRGNRLANRQTHENPLQQVYCFALAEFSPRIHESVRALLCVRGGKTLRVCAQELGLYICVYTCTKRY